MRRIGLYSLIAFACLALVGVLAAGVGSALNSGGGETRVAQANTPTVAEPPAPETVPEETKEETKEEKTEEQQSEGEKEAEEREAAKQEAAEQEAAEQEAAEQEAAEQEAAEQERWREIAEQREAEQRAAEQAAAAEERAAAQEAAPAVPTSTALNLTVPKIGLQNNPVTNSVSEGVLANGAGKLPSTGFPWQAGANTYIAAHVYGYPGTGSWQQFAGLPNMVQGDQIFLTDSSGTTYEYRVSEILRVAPTEVWVAQSTGQNIVSLQTCVGPGWSERLVVRGTLVGTSQA